MSRSEGRRQGCEAPTSGQVAPHALLDLTAAASAAPGADLTARLAAIAGDLRVLWGAALESGDFDEITRLTEAGHAVHRAVLALTTDSHVAARAPSGSSAPEGTLRRAR